MTDLTQEITATKRLNRESSALGPGYLLLQKQKAAVKKMGINHPFFRTCESPNQNTVCIEGREYINYCSYDYLGFSDHPYVADRVMRAIQQYGTSCSASRMAGGEKKLHRELEQAIAKLLNVDDALVFVGGYTTNVSCIEHLFGPKDLVLHDSLAHNSILKGCMLSGAQRVSFPHDDTEALENILKERRDAYRKVLIVIEGLYSMDGDIPDLSKYVAIKKKYGAWLMVDEAHSMGVIGKTGRGISEYASVDPKDVDIWMGTLSKAFASCGGYLAGSADFIDYLRYSTPGFIYSAGISPPTAAAALGAIEQFVKEPERVSALQKKSRLFLEMCKKRGFDVGKSRDSAIVPVMTGSSENALYLTDELFQAKINVFPLFHPAVKKDAARLRFFITYKHTEKEIAYTIDVLERSWKKIESREFIPFALA